MKPGLRPLLRAAAAMVSAALIAATSASTSASAASGKRSDSVLITVSNVSPSTPRPTQRLRPLTITLTLQNTTDTQFSGVRVVGERGDPIGSQQALDDSLTSPTLPTSSIPIRTDSPVTVDLAGGASTTVTFTTTTGIPTSAGLCVCAAHEIYPLFFSAHFTDGSGVDQLLGVTSTYVPSFYARPKPVRVAWIWPLLERPHRLGLGNVFTDDALADLIGPAGRLTRALEVVEQASGDIPITLLIDPDLLDEIEVMSTGAYVVMQDDGSTSPGAGKDVAVAWLARLHDVLTNEPDVQVALTPYADPDFESLTARGLKWTSGVPATLTADVTAALAGRPLDAALAWPAGGALSRPTLARLAGNGVSTVLLNSTAVVPASAAGDIKPGLARLHVGGHDVAAALLSAPIERYAAQSVSLSRPPATALPSLVAELAIRAVQEPEAEHAVVIAPPRYVDPDVAAAVRAIRDTTTSTFATPISLRDAVGSTLMPTGRDGLARVPLPSTNRSASTLDAAAHALSSLPGIRALLDRSDPSARRFYYSLPRVVQRAESAAWRDLPTEADAYASQLNALIDRTTSGVQIVRPSSGVYTLASSTSPLPITVDNKLPYPVFVRIEITTDPPGIPGFRTHDLGKQRIEATTKRLLHVPTTTERSGRIPIVATLVTPNTANRVPLGSPVRLTIRSTALGFIGVLITVVAGVVLAAALLWRFVRRIRARRAKARPPQAVPPVPVDQPERIG